MSERPWHRFSDPGVAAHHPDGAHLEEGLHHLEGFLVWQAEAKQARSAAQRFSDRLPWLTTAQREEVIRVYTADRMETSRATIRRLAERSNAMRQEYTARYSTLRARLFGWSLAATAVAILIQELLVGP
ncbi:Flp pilus assembly protein TadB [Streptacidiphilus sp. MAP5-52]